MDSLDYDLSKELLKAWLIYKVSHDILIDLHKNISKEEIYESYMRGKEAILDYYWKDVRARLQGRSEYKPADKLIEALDLCTRSFILKNFIPFISVGRLCFSKTRPGQPYSNDCLCLNIIDNKVEVASYQHEDVRLFVSPLEAINHIEHIYENLSK